MTDHSLSKILVGLSTAFAQEPVTLGDVVKALPRGSYEILIFVFALFLALPIPYPPGLSTILVIPIILLNVQQIAGRPIPWLPRQVRGKSFSNATLQKVIGMALPWILKLEYFLRPRMQFITHGIALRLTAFCMLVMAVCIAVPFPLTNKVPAICITLTCAAIMMHDGIVTACAIVVGLIWVFLLAFLGAEGFMLLWDLLKGWLS